ncbi:MAG: polysaccharide deacetylase family protein, partial [Fibrobacter sp.]|nr:polysaccharide deacetylase family protein [Fibrobacter sp.]MBR6943801.1 polysaccharide deacetylase family protein [Fibrobacter sp.]
MNNKKISIAAAATGLFMVGTAFAQTAEIGTWAGFRKGAASFTFDDGAPSHVTDAGPMFKKYGYKATFNLVVNWNPNWSGFQGLADEGHEIA